METDKSEQSKSPSKGHVAERLVRLVSVGLKEATMDSPSFRASMNYMHLSIIQCFHQLDNSLVVLQKYSNHWVDFIKISGELENLFKPYLNDIQFVANDVSKPCIEKFLEGQKIIFESALSLLKIGDISFANIKELIQIEIPHYIEMRRNFEKIQNKYDVISAKFMQLPKNYDPAKTREDALQLFEIRKQYIHLSMSLWVCIKQLEVKISKAVTDVSASIWNSFDSSSTEYGAKLSDAIGLTPIVSQIKLLNSCTDLQYSSSKLLANDLDRARANSEEGAIKIYSPSSEISDYDPSTLNYTNLYLDSEVNVAEKHGWVFIKSPKLNSKSEVWIKRWMFVKNGVFGFLSISKDGQFVQESDTIGVLLVSVKYLPTEDRKFCFEMNSKLTNLVVQVETCSELKSWITVFRNVTKIAVDENSKAALDRYSPPLQMLRLVPVVAKDFELINVTKADANMEKTSKLIELQLSNLKFRLCINPPIRTSMTGKIAMSHLYFSSTTIPSATTANFWGYVNWGLYFVLDDETKATILQKTKNLFPKPILNLRYPDYYPEGFRVADAELRSIFEVMVSDNEYTLLRISASWSPNAQQRLFCTLYITNFALYVYSHTYGLISITPIPLTSFMDCDIFEKVDHNVLKVYFVSGVSIKMQIYSDNIEVVKSQFNFILQNKRSNNPQNLQNIIAQLLNIEKSYCKMKLEKRSNSSSLVSKLNPNFAQSQGIKLEFPADFKDDNLGINDISRGSKLNYSPEMNLLMIKKFNVPAKALFHILFGDESFLLQCTLPLSSTIFKDDESRHSLWRCDSKQQMTRVVWNPLFKVPCAKQTIEEMVNNKYYNIVQQTPYLRFVFGINRKISMRFIIFNVNSKSCKLMVYYSLGGNNNVLYWFTRKVMHQIMIFRMEALEHKVDHAIKEISHENKKIASAIKIYGAVTKFDSDEMTKEELSFKDSVSFLPLQLFSSFYYEKVNFELEKMFINFIKIFSSIIKKIISFFSSNLFFVILFSASILLNLFLAGRTTTSYWRERNVNKQVKNIVGDKFLMERSISLSDIDDLIYPNSTELSVSENGTECYWKFLDHENLLDLNRYSHLTSGGKNFDKHDMEMKVIKGKREHALAQKLTGLRIERNELLTKLNLLNYIEREYILKEWKNWISSEISNCKRVHESYPEMYEAISEYCKDVEYEMINFYENLL